MRICKVIFSTNRLKYLIPTLESFHKNLDFGDHEVDGIFVDDWPTGRNDTFIEALAKKYGYTRVVLHSENQGISNTWNQVNEILSEKEYDYVWHQEDDVELLQPLHINDLIKIMNDFPHLFQLVLKRDVWYSNEVAELTNPNDVILDKYRFLNEYTYFTPIACFYRYWISQMKLKETTGMCPAEGLVMQTARERTNYTQCGAIVKNLDGSPIINHIGEVTRGKRLNQGEWGWERFAWMDTTKDYCSRTGIEKPLDPK